MLRIKAIKFLLIKYQNRDSAVGKATNYELNDREVGVSFPISSRIFPFPCRSNWLWGLRSQGVKVTTPNQCLGQENVDLCIHSPICLHGVVLN
jgi:hypothetical protein